MTLAGVASRNCEEPNPIGTVHCQRTFAPAANLSAATVFKPTVALRRHVCRRWFGNRVKEHVIACIKLARYLSQLFLESAITDTEPISSIAAKEKLSNIIRVDRPGNRGVFAAPFAG